MTLTTSSAMTIVFVVILTLIALILQRNSLSGVGLTTKTAYTYTSSSGGGRGVGGSDGDGDANYYFGDVSPPPQSNDNHYYNSNGTSVAAVDEEELSSRQSSDDGPSSNSKVHESISLQRGVNISFSSNEPYANRWQRRFSSSESRGKKTGYLFFKHIRKAGGTSLRNFFYHALEDHDQSRTFDLSVVATADLASGRLEEGRGGTDRVKRYKKLQRDTALKDERRGSVKHSSDYIVHYLEQEFDAMDWQCSSTDPRWNDTLRIIALRHPIERQLSEFFFSGPGKKYRLDKTLLYSNETLDNNELSRFIEEQFPLWMDGMTETDTKQKPMLQEQEQRAFGRFYTDNFQLRSLAGCAQGNCLDEYNGMDDVEKTQMQNQLKSSLVSYQNNSPQPNCTHFFIREQLLYDTCHKIETAQCQHGCDGPCFYKALARGVLTRKHLDRAIHSLESFDAVLLMERLNDEDQSDFVSDVFGVPQDATFALKNMMEQSSNGNTKQQLPDHIQAMKYKRQTNTNVEKNSRREKTHFYRDLLSKLGLNRLSDLLHRENELEIEMYEHAERLNGNMIDQWKSETNWQAARSTKDSAGARSVTNETNTQVQKSQRPNQKDDAIAADHKNPANQTEDAHDYGVIIVHYHKTGYVLSRILMKLTIGLEYEARGRSSKEVNYAKNVQGHAINHTDEITGERIAFDQRGNWNSNFVGARRHTGVTNCPDFRLSGGAIYLQEAPDFFCGDVKLSRMILGVRDVPRKKYGKAKILHFVRNPFEMVLSNYFYHAQEPSPEKWVHRDDPCETNYLSRKSLASLVLPTFSNRTNITQQQLDAVVTMCESLYQTNSSLSNATFYEHLLKLNHWDGLRLATAQMVISSSVANEYMAGGDILRMANNIIKFKNLKTSPWIPREKRERLHLLTLSMDDYISNNTYVTMRYLDFVLGSDDTVVPREMRVRAAESQGNPQGAGSHVTQGKHGDREELKQALRDDPVLGPILSEVEVLVKEALHQSNGAWTW